MPTSRSYLNPEERQRTLLEAANRLFDAGGFDAITNVAVAQEAGVSRALVYSFFPDNAALRLAYFAERVDRYQHLMDSVVVVDGQPAAARTIAVFRTLCNLPLTDLRSLNAVLNAHGNDQLAGMQEALRRFTYERWTGTLDFERGPVGLFPALWLFLGISISMAISVARGEMTADGAEELLLALANAAMTVLQNRA